MALFRGSIARLLKPAQVRHTLVAMQVRFCQCVDACALMNVCTEGSVPHCAGKTCVWLSKFKLKPTETCFSFHVQHKNVKSYSVFVRVVFSIEIRWSKTARCTRNIHCNGKEYGSSFEFQCKNHFPFKLDQNLDHCVDKHPVTVVNQLYLGSLYLSTSRT